MTFKLHRVGFALIAVTFACTGVLVYGNRAGEPRRSDSEPLAVHVVQEGDGVEIVIDQCLDFEVTEVELVAFRVIDGIASDQEAVIWRYRPVSSTQTRFIAPAHNGQTLVPFNSLKSLPTSYIFGVYVYYNQKTAPRKFQDRTALSMSFHRSQSKDEVRRFESLASKDACK